MTNTFRSAGGVMKLRDELGLTMLGRAAVVMAVWLVIVFALAALAVYVWPAR